MKRVLAALFIIIGIKAASAATLLDTFEQTLTAMGRYCVEFTVTMDQYSTSGRYVVSGNDFYAAVEGVEYYVAGGVKHEVNSQTKEIIVDSADSLGSDIISNPAQGFAALARDFDVVDTTVAGRKAVTLTPKQGGADSIVVVADQSGTLPQRIVYCYDTAQMVVELSRVERFAAELPTFDRSKYVDFELVDMR